jgi:hypothetical protein
LKLSSEVMSGIPILSYTRQGVFLYRRRGLAYWLAADDRVLHLRGL